MGTKRARIHCSEANSPEKRSTSFVLPLCTFRVEERFEGFRHLLIEDVSIAHRRFNRGAREQYRRRAGANRRLSDRGVPHFEPTAFHPPFLDPVSCARSPILLEGALDCWHTVHTMTDEPRKRGSCATARAFHLPGLAFPFKLFPPFPPLVLFPPLPPFVLFPPHRPCRRSSRCPRLRWRRR